MNDAPVLAGLMLGLPWVVLGSDAQLKLLMW